jgi:hypothetical protein
LTASGAVRIIPFVLKTSVIPAAVLAAGFASVCVSTPRRMQSRGGLARFRGTRPPPREDGPTTPKKAATRTSSSHPEGGPVSRIRRSRRSGRGVAVETPESTALPPARSLRSRQPLHRATRWRATLHRRPGGSPEARLHGRRSSKVVVRRPPAPSRGSPGRWGRCCDRSRQSRRPAGGWTFRPSHGGRPDPRRGVDAAGLKDSFLNSRGKHRSTWRSTSARPGDPGPAAADGDHLAAPGVAGHLALPEDSTGRYLLFYCHLTRYKKRGLRAGRRCPRAT